MAQTYSSKNTSREQLPALHKSPIVTPFLSGAKVLDYGAGKSHNKAHDYVMSRKARAYAWYDPYWNSNKGNAAALMQSPFDVILCANVVNVIDDMSAIRDLIGVCLSLLRHEDTYSGVFHLSVYEGDKTGVGCATRDGYQRNETTEQAYYMIDTLAREFLPDVITQRKGKVITLRYPLICERCKLKSVTVCQMCTDYGGMTAHPYYDVSPIVCDNVQRLTAFEDIDRNRSYAETLYNVWHNTCNAKTYEVVGNAFLQARDEWLGVNDSDD